MVVIKTKPRGRIEYEEKESQEPYQVDAPTPSRMVVENEAPTLASTLTEDEIVEVGGTNVNVSEQDISDGDEEGKVRKTRKVTLIVMKKPIRVLSRVYNSMTQNRVLCLCTMSGRGGGSSRGRGPGRSRGGGRITVSTTPTNDPAPGSEPAPPPPISAPASSPAPPSTSTEHTHTEDTTSAPDTSEASRIVTDAEGEFV
ncbi:hypothetical protein PIB30_067624 [Stylosanthes scabra]|uniref:Uncharacterized protein n=1 Tax=Stylosanthes scabra TaxID=79078 RepID=A0ABU6ULI4_9FABA|nr:hypothetical protein [Stylosanthes scabra]